MSMYMKTNKINAAKQHSLDNGDKQIIGGMEYRGTPPVYANMKTDPLLPVEFVKVKKGIPFVRA